MSGLYPFQETALADLEAVLRGATAPRALLAAPTGSGKTIIAAALIRQSNTKVLFLAHRRELIHQAANKLRATGIEPGIILAGEDPTEMADVQVASIQTLWRRRAYMPPADLVVVDEAHHVRARTYATILAHYPNAAVVGLTATPCRADGRGLGNFFTAMVQCPPVDELIRAGYLVPTRVFAPSTPDLRGVHVRMGDYVERELAAAVDRPKLVGDIVSHWHRLAGGRKTVVFATGVEHSIHIKDEFVRSGVRAAHIDGSTPKSERDGILERLSCGELELVSNCAVLVEGWDMPCVEVCILARPTKSFGLYRQMVGRVLRPYPGKGHCLVLDHAGSTYEHGFVEDEVLWALEEDRKARSVAHVRRHMDGRARLTACTQCGSVRAAGQPCPECGFKPTRGGRFVDALDGELAHLGRNGRLQPHEYTPEQCLEWHRMLTDIAHKRVYKLGWVAVKYKEKFGRWPPQRSVPPMPANAEVLAWVRIGNLRYAKAMKKAGGGSQ